VVAPHLPAGSDAARRVRLSENAVYGVPVFS
jgi:hypothetical protein